MSSILIYGAYGYSGRLAALHAATLQLNVIVAGRNAESVQKIALETGFPMRVFGLDSASEIAENLEGVSVVLNCAGPFSRTARPLADTCIRNGVHYLDITGEIEVIEAMAERSAAAKEQGVTLMPATGFDVVPTDSVAAYLKAKLPDATHLQLAFHSQGGLSHGTAQTMVENLGGTGARRENGQIVAEPVASSVIQVPFLDKPRTGMSIPWGDVASAYYTTGIPNIQTYTTASPRAARWIQRTNAFHHLGGLKPIKSLAASYVSRKITGPDEDARSKGRTQIWGLAWNAAGEKASVILETLEGYTLTYLASVDLARRAQAGELPTGFTTPAGALGSDYVLQFEPSRFTDLTPA